MQLIDFFSGANPRASTDRKEKILSFRANAQKRPDFVTYGRVYFDDPDYGVGYGGYYYDGRYGPSVDKIISYYGLKDGDRVLEIGCAKGYILYEFYARGLSVNGIDISAYAVDHAMNEVKPFIIEGSAASLPWPTGHFDFVFSKETLPHLSMEQLISAIGEAKRVCRTDNIFFEIQVGNDSDSQQLIMAWDETHQIVKDTKWWLQFLATQGYSGQVNFKALF